MLGMILLEVQPWYVYVLGGILCLAVAGGVFGLLINALIKYFKNKKTE